LSKDGDEGKRNHHCLHNLARNIYGVYKYPEERNTADSDNSTISSKNDDENLNSEKIKEVEEEIKLQLLQSKIIPDKDYAEFVIKVVKKTVKQEDSLIRQIFYTSLSAYTNDPINLGIIAPTSEGKTYPVIETLKHFPKEDVWLIGSMSTKLLVRQKGTLVDENNELLKPKIKELRERIEDNTQDKIEKQELEEQLSELYENARSLIDLQDKILVFLEPPQHDLWNLLKPILSHDAEEIEFPYVDKTEKKGLQPKRVIVRGWPACIFCSARDESNWPVWPEIQSRFLITSPNMNPIKYQESNILIAQRKGLPTLVQQRIIISDEDVELAKKCVVYLKHEINKLSSASKAGHNPVWIPFNQVLAEVLPAEKGTDTRTTKRIFSLLQIIPLAKAHLRHKLILGPETLVIAALEDLGEVLHITQNISGMPAYKLKFLKEIFLPLYKSKSEPDKGEEGKEEKRIAVTTKQLCDYFKEQEGKIVTTNNLKKTYLDELLNNGYIDEEDSVIDKRQKIYYPLIEFPIERQEEGEKEESKIKNCLTLGRVDNFFQYSRITMPKNCRDIPEDWLRIEILGLIKYPLKLDKFTLLDKGNDNDGEQQDDEGNNNVNHGQPLCICRFVNEYEKNSKLNGYFSRHRIASEFHKIFPEIKYLEEFNANECEKLSTPGKVLQFDISNNNDYQLKHIDDSGNLSKGIQHQGQEELRSTEREESLRTEEDDRKKGFGDDTADKVGAN
jgi:hypothetical protein